MCKLTTRKKTRKISTHNIALTGFINYCFIISLSDLTWKEFTYSSSITTKVNLSTRDYNNRYCKIAKHFESVTLLRAVFSVTIVDKNK